MKETNDNNQKAKEMEELVLCQEIKKWGQCLGTGCKKTASFSELGKRKWEFCVTHKAKNMVDVKNKTCAEEGCVKQPFYNIPTEKVGKYCVDHKSGEMVNVIDKTCAKDGCVKIPSYNVPTEKVGLFCVAHKSGNMVDVKNKTCAKDGCVKQPYYNVPTEKVGLFCVTHKSGEMVDVVHKRCTKDGCDTQPHYNERGKKGGLFCVDHKEPGMVDVVNKTCKHEWCDTRVHNKKYQGYCLYCFINKFPNEPVSRNYKTKEKATADFITRAFPQFTFRLDKQVIDGCSRRRPDILMEFAGHVVVVEVDENQHGKYNITCENRRVVEMYQDMGGRNLVLIRFNPDKYTSENGTKIPSCWSHTKNGISYVSKKKAWRSRLNVLVESIRYWMENQTEKMIEIKHLFYDV